MANRDMDQPETPQSGRRDKTSDTGKVGGGAPEDMRSIADDEGDEGDEELEDTEDLDEEEDQDNRA